VITGKKWAYVLSRSHGTGDWLTSYETITVEHIDLATTTLDEARGGVRDWALTVTNAEQPLDGDYRVSLVELDEAGEFDLYFAEEDEDIFWRYGVPHVALAV
jgi:hypothetical protein